MGRRLSAPLLLAGATLVALSCDGIDNLSVDSTATSVVPASTPLEQVLGSVPFSGFEGFDFSETQEFANEGYTKDQIDSVRVVSLTLRIVAPQDGDFDFVDSIAFSVESEGLPAVEIARLDPVPEGQTEIELTVDSSIELVDYATAPTMSITTDATGGRPSEETTIEGTVLFDVDVNVSGAACGG